MRTDDNRCRECGTHLVGKEAQDVGYCLPCFNKMMSDDNEEEEDRDYLRDEINRHKREADELKSLLLESWQMWKDLAEAGELKIGPNYWVRYAEMKLKVEAITEK